MARAQQIPRARLPRAAYVRRRVVAGAAFLAVLAGLVYAPLALLAPLEPVSAAAAAPEPVSVDAPELAWPGEGAAAIGALELPGSIARHGAEDALPLASITKVVTALVVLEARPLEPDEAGPDIRIESRDLRYYSGQIAAGGSATPVAVGQVYSQLELLQIMLIRSSNNLAQTLADWAFGDEAGFRAAAADWAERHGLASLRVVEPAGLDPGNVAVVDELVELGRIALADPVVARIAASGSETVPYLGRIENTNELLGEAGVTGIKTGTLRVVGANLLFSASVPVGDREITVVGAVIGAPDHEVLRGDVRRLLASAAEHLAIVPLAAAGDELGRYTSDWGDEARALALEDAEALVWGDVEIPVRLELDELVLAPRGSAWASSSSRRPRGP